MGRPKPPESAILFSGFLYAEESCLHKALGILQEHFSGPLFVTQPILWQHSQYYREELGWPIYRRFALYDRIIDPSEIVDIKLLTNQIEESLSEGGRRTVNIDPGYVTLSKVVLATTKNHAHRLYLGRGIYGEVTLYYRGGSFRAHQFTYPDFSSQPYIEIFNRIRQYLKERTNS